MHTEMVAGKILDLANGKDRFIVAICGAPGAGKSTLAEALSDRLNKQGNQATILSMDGFHFDDTLLEARGWRARKGAPYTFDADGLLHTLQRVRDQIEDVCVPVFDRSMELARAGARMIERTCPIIIVEGNYLLLNQAPWSRLNPLFDLTIFLKVDIAELENRSINRWLHHNFTKEQAQQKAQSNDLPNANYVIDNSVEADMVLKNQDEH